MQRMPNEKPQILPEAEPAARILRNDEKFN
jgi:hypothetical protein